MYRGAGLLESYQRQVQSLDGGLQELEENIDTVREVRMLPTPSNRTRIPYIVVTQQGCHRLTAKAHWTGCRSWRKTCEVRTSSNSVSRTYPRACSQHVSNFKHARAFPLERDSTTVHQSRIPGVSPVLHCMCGT